MRLDSTLVLARRQVQYNFRTDTDNLLFILLEEGGGLLLMRALNFASSNCILRAPTHLTRQSSE